MLNSIILNGSNYELIKENKKSNYSYFTYLSQNEKTIEQKTDTIIGGFDTEYVNYNEKDEDRQVVSYQFWCDYQDKKMAIIIIPEKDKRLKFKEFLNLLTIELCSNFKIPVEFNLCLVSHWGLVDYSCLDGIKKGLLKKRSVFQYKKCLFTSKSVKFNTYKDEKQKTKRICNLTIRDSYLCGPAKFSLEKLGKSINIEKIELPEGMITNMNKLLKDNEELFIKYAIQDCIITAEWVKSTYGTENIPTTVGQYASEWAEKYLRDKKGWNDKSDYLKNYLGKTTLKVQKRKHITEENICIPYMASVETLAMRSVKGGLNAAYSCGLFKGNFLDIDICGAYPTAASCLKDIDFNVIPSTISGMLNLNVIRPDEYGFGYVKFKFPDDCQFPCLCIKDVNNRGLICPLEGITYATNQEVYLALLLGAEVIALDYRLLQSKDTYVYRDLFKEATYERMEYTKGTAKELLIKERNNSIVGKVGQGINDYLLNKKDGMPFSDITSPYYYATITSIIRSFLLYTMNWLYSQGHYVHSVTTDGFITDAPMQLIDKMPENTLVKMLKEARYYISGEPDIFAVKHSMDILVNIKTRANIGLNDDNSGQGVLACGNFKIPKEIKEKMAEDERKEIAKLYFKRSKNNPVKYEFQRFTTWRRFLLNNELDISSYTENREANWEYDFKQQPYNIIDLDFHYDGEVFIVPTFKTKPWKNIDTFTELRDFIDSDKIVFNKTEYYKEIPFLYNARIAGIKITNINKTKADQMFRMYLIGVIDCGELSKDEVIDKITSYYNIKASRVFYGNNKRKGNIVLPVEVLKNDIKQNGFKIIDKENAIYII